MNSTRFTLPPTAAAAAVLFALVGALELVHEQVNPFADVLDYAIEGVFVAALAVGTSALWQLGERGARIAFRAAAVGHSVVGLAAAATFLRGQESLDPVFPLGVLAILVGLIAATVLDLRGKVAPPRAAIALLAGWVPAFILDTPLGIGAAWLVVALLASAKLAPRRAATA
jgi:hypothetical protein